MASPPCPTLSVTSPQVSSISAPASMAPSALTSNTTASESISAPASFLQACVPIVASSGPELLPTASIDQMSNTPSSLPITAAAANLHNLPTAATVMSPTSTTILPDVLPLPGSILGQSLGDRVTAVPQPGIPVEDQAPTPYQSPPAAVDAVISPATSQLGMEQHVALTQVTHPAPQQPQTQLQPALPKQVLTVQQPLQAMPQQDLQPQHQVYQEQIQLQQELTLQQSLQQLQHQQLIQKQVPLQPNLICNTELLQQSVPMQNFLPPLALQQTPNPTPQHQTQQYDPQLLQQSQLQQLPQRVVPPQAAVVPQQQGHIDHQQQQQQLHLQQTMHLQQQQLQQHQHQMFVSGNQQFIQQQQQQQQLDVSHVQQQLIPHQAQAAAEPALQHVQSQLQHLEQQQEMVIAMETTPNQQHVTLQKQSSLQMSESEVSTGETSVTEDTCSYSVPFHPCSESSLPPLHLGTTEAPLPTLSLTMTPSPAQPSSVAESDSEGPPKIDYVDNRIKTLDEKLRTLLYQEYSSGAVLAGGAASGNTSAASTSAGGDESSEPQSTHHLSFPLPASSSDTSPRSSSSTTSSTTSRSSSTSPDPERARSGEEASVEVPNISEVLPVEQQPGPSFPSPSASSTPPTSLLSPNQDGSPWPQRPPVPGEPTVLVSECQSLDFE